MQDEHDDDTLEAPDAEAQRVARDFGVTLGKQYKPGAPVYFTRCPCGVLQLTKRDHHMQSSECAQCRTARDQPTLHTQPLRGRSLFDDRTSKVVVVALVVIAMLWLGFSLQRAPSRPETSDEVSLS